DVLDDAHWERRLVESGRCSALVRLADGDADLYMGHATWDDYSKMMRIFKFYNFSLPEAETAATKISFSSYPGVITTSAVGLGMPTTIPLDAPQRVGDPTVLRALQQQYGGGRQADKDGSLYAHIGNKPIPPPKALRKIHAHRQEERQQQADEQEAEEFERKMGMEVRESRTVFGESAVTEVAAAALRRREAQEQLDGCALSEAASCYELSGCGLAECNGRYDFSEASSRGAPVYQNPAGWILHMDRVPELDQIGTDDEKYQFGWLVSKDRKPFYGVRTNDVQIPSVGWQCFYGPPPGPAAVRGTNWEEHFLATAGSLKEEGNVAMKAGRSSEAEQHYGEAIGLMLGYDGVVEASRALRELQLALFANRAEARLRQQLWEKSLEDSEFVLAKDPLHAKAAVRLAKAWKGLGCLGRAAEALSRLRGPRGAGTELEAWYEEAEILHACDAWEAEASAASDAQKEEMPTARCVLGVHKAARQLQQRATEWGRQKDALNDAQDFQAEQQLASLAQVLAGQLSRLEAQVSEDPAVRKSLGLLLRGHGILDLVVSALSTPSSSNDSDDEDGDDAWPLVVLQAMCAVSPELPGEGELRKLLASIPKMVAQLTRRPQLTLQLVRSLLRHRLKQRLFVADTLVESRGFLARCLRSWARTLDDRLGSEGLSPDDLRAATSEVLQELAAQTQRLHNAEALALALFVEGFIGERLGSGLSGGFVLHSGAAVRRVVLALLSSWSENPRILRSFSPELVGKLWASCAAKLRRDAGVETHRDIQTPSGTVKMEWFKLKPTQTLKKGYGAFHPEELAAAVMRFLVAHLLATCDRGCEEIPREGIAPRAPAEEWAQDVLDRPFGWGVLVPLVVAPANIAGEALLLLELLVQRHPNNDKVAKRLAGFHVFMPLLHLPWPQASPVESHLRATLSGPSQWRSACSVLQCAMDTELGMRVARDHTDLCFEGAVRVLHEVLGDSEPQSVFAATELFGQLCSQLGCFEKVTTETLFCLLQHFARSDHADTRSQMAKLLRLMYANQSTKEKLRDSLSSKELGLTGEQQSRVMQEVFDARTLAGQVVGEKLAKAAKDAERQPFSPVPGVAEGLATTLQPLLHTEEAASLRLLVLGRLARTVAPQLAQQGCQVVLGETSLDRLSGVGKGVTTVLLPVPEAISGDPHLASPDLFDVVLAVEPLGYLDLAEYADKLRPYIRRRATEEDRTRNQVQMICVELQDRLEDARDELYSAGYYLADSHPSLPGLRKAMASKAKGGHGPLDVTLLRLPSAEKERKKARETQEAQERKVQREAEEVEKAEQEEEEMVQKTVLQTALFDPVLMIPEAASLPVAVELGPGPGEAEQLLLWLPGNQEPPELWRSALASISLQSLRVLVVGRPRDSTNWHSWTDQAIVAQGMQWYEMHEMPTEEAIAKAAKDPATNVSFGKPSVPELRCLEQVEVGCKQLYNLLEREVQASERAPKVWVGGFSQGGSVAAYSVLSKTAPAKVQAQMVGVILCGCAIPAFQFLASKMQDQCLRARDVDLDAPVPQVQVLHCQDDPEVSKHYAQTVVDLSNRFEFPAQLLSFKTEISEHLPGGPRPLPGSPERWLPPLLSRALTAVNG
ncbi:Plbd1, partial [Symbiodinium sp. CCMP2456]